MRNAEKYEEIDRLQNEKVEKITKRSWSGM